jgi:radical SAM superfamily enzyme YgiQ (UPF0313 family)
LRRAIGKRLTNDDLLAGCQRAFERGFNRVKLYFMCGLPGETEEDLDAIIDLSEQIARLGRQCAGRWPTIVANVSNLVPKPQTPLQRDAMARREYFEAAHRRLRDRRQLRAVAVKCHDIETSLLEAVIARADRRMADVIESAWRAGARFDAWHDHFQADLWWTQLAAHPEIDTDALLHHPLPDDAPLPWQHIAIGR